MHAGRRARRPARHPDDDPAAPRAHRAAARHPQVPRGHGLRRSAQGGRFGGVEGRGLGRGEGARWPPPAASNIGAKTIFAGFGIGFVYKVVNKALLRLEGRCPRKSSARRSRPARSAAEVNPALLGVGYIIGPRIASIMCAGGVLAYLVLIPAIKFFGSGMTGGARRRATMPISEMGPNEIRGAYVLYIGAGAVAAGGIISLFRSLPTIWHGLKGGMRDLRGGQAASDARAAHRPGPLDEVRAHRHHRADGRHRPVPATGPALTTPVVAILGALLIIAFGFLFVTVSSRLTGEIGSSSNPISGMTVATLLLTCLVFLLVGWTGPAYYVTALSIGAIVCIASSNGGTTSQDLKTGFLVGATPKYQQIAILIGARRVGADSRADSSQAERRGDRLRAGQRDAGRNPPRARATRPRPSRCTGPEAAADARHLPRLAQHGRRDRARRQVPRGRPGRAGVPGRPRHQRDGRRSGPTGRRSRSSTRRRRR